MVGKKSVITLIITQRASGDSIENELAVELLGSIIRQIMERIIATDVNQPLVIERAVKVLVQGGLVLFPTETTYGAGVDACNPQAVTKLLTYKSRREGKPLSIAVTDLAMAQLYVTVNDQAKTLYQQFLPGPVTIVSRGKGVVAAGVESEFGTLGVRIPDYPLVHTVINTLGRPITATSANSSGEKRPYSIEDVLAHLSAKQTELIDLIIDAGQLPVRPPSTVIDTTLSTPITLREGAIVVKQSTANTNHSTSLSSSGEEETKHIAGQLMLKQWDALSRGPIIVALDGPLGAGKTVFAKGVAEFLKITMPLTSPTYTYIEEYAFKRHDHSGTLFHLDMWKVDSEELFERLEFAQLLAPNSVIVIEWWDQVAAYIKPLLAKNPHVLIECELKDERTSTTRQITFREEINV